jgi:ribosomal protein S18 acetylase RimI-like enzyme
MFRLNCRTEKYRMNIDEFRTASKPEAEQIANLVNKAYRPESGKSGWTHESDLVAGARTNADQVLEIMTKPDSIILVGIKEAGISACIHLEKNGNNCYVGMLAVSPRLQETGIGKQMLAYAERYAIESFRPEKFIMLVMSARSELIEFYIRRGYQKTGVVMDYPSFAGVGTPKQNNQKVEVLEKNAQTKDFMIKIEAHTTLPSF